MNNVLYFVLTLFGIGVLAIARINTRRTQEERKTNWIKFITYFLIQWTLIGACLYSSYALAICLGLIGLLCLVEIFKQKYNGLALKVKVSAFVFGCALVGMLGLSVLPTEVQLFTLIQVSVFDAFSQLSGQLIGSQKLVPRISPNKTISGFIGGLLALALSALLVMHWLGLSPETYVWISFGIACFAFLGDLLASYIKRQLGIKDFSSWIPGHGGFMDRFDSLAFAASFVYLYAYWISL